MMRVLSLMRLRFRSPASFGLCVLLGLFGSPVPLLGADSASTPTATRAAFRPSNLAALDLAISTAISNRAAPGAVLWLERYGASYHRAFGSRAILPDSETMTEDTIFDVASLTKVLATAPAVMLLVERGRIGLDEPAKKYLPGFTGDSRDAVTVRDLLTHTSGLRSGLGLFPGWSGYDEAIQRAIRERPEFQPGTRFVYSDVNFILLGEIVQRASGRPFDEFCATEVFRPLGMNDTSFRPKAFLRSRIAPTTREGGEYLRGVVHDPTARRMGGVAGHAGVFSTAADIARYCRVLLADGAMPGGRFMRPETVALMTRVHTPPTLPGTRRALGWDVDTAYSGARGNVFPVGSYGLTGWTGTSMWLDPFSRTFVILLSNRNHPSEDGNVLALRRRVGTLAAEAVEDFNFAGVPGALPRWDPAAAEKAAITNAARSTGGVTNAARRLEVRNGIDVLVEQGFAPLKKLRIGLITNHTGTDRERRPTVDLLKAAPDVDLRVLFSPEHGIRGELDDKVPDGRDARTGLPIISLYGETRQPRPEHLAGVDALVFDIQDIGCRFYTYISTMGLCLEAAAKHRLRFIVLDRANPIHGARVEGPVYAGEPSFVAFHALPIRHGMTVGELARMFNEERGWNADLTVIPVEGWRRDQWFDETGLPWIRTSPNMRNLTEAMLYPGIGLLEFAVSVGRGTDTPFELVGAPYIDDRLFAATLNDAGLPGIRFVPVRFTPKESVFKGRECGGVYLVLTDRDSCRVVDVGLWIALTLRKLYPKDFDMRKLNTLLLDSGTLDAISAGKSLQEIKALWATRLGEFMARRGRYLGY